MKRNLVIALLLLFALVASVPVLAQEPAQPTEQHQVLKADVGSWNADIKMWMAGPDAEPMSSKGVETNHMMGGLWLLSKFEGEFAGQKFTGHGQFGYDPVKKKYIGTWIDSMNPHMSTMEGTYDAKSKTMTMLSEGIDGNSGQMMKGKNVGKQIDKDTRLFTMYMFTPGGDEVKIMEIKYTRKK